VFEDGHVTTIDERSLRSEARALRAARQPELTAAAAAAHRLEPYYREMYLRTASRDVGLSRRPG
jgi:hypothetical protein